MYLTSLRGGPIRLHCAAVIAGRYMAYSINVITIKPKTCWKREEAGN